MGHHCSSDMFIVINSKGQWTGQLSQEKVSHKPFKAETGGPRFETRGHEVCVLRTSALLSLSPGSTAL